MTGPSMTIGVDARELLGDTTGVGRYLGELLRRWTRPGADDPRFLLYSPEPLSLRFSPDRVELHIGGRGRGTWWEQTWLRSAVREDRPDVFFAPAYTAPLGIDAPLALTIHDVSFFAHPEWFRLREGPRRRFLTRRAAEAASVIFTDSEFSRGEIEQHLQVPPSRIRVIPPGLTPRGASPQPDAPRQRLVLFVGSIFNRRRLPDLMAAFARATRELPDARLVIVGDDRTWPPQNLRAVADDQGIGARVEFRNYVPDDQLSALYGEASVFGFLSEYEGFGLTPLEALSAGVPPVVLDTPVARDVYGDAAVYVAPDDVRGAADAIRTLLVSEEARARVLAAAPAVLARYSWDAAARETLAEMRRIARP